MQSQSQETGLPMVCYLDHRLEHLQHHIETLTKLRLKNFTDRHSIELLQPKIIFVTTEHGGIY